MMPHTVHEGGRALHALLVCGERKRAALMGGPAAYAGEAMPRPYDGDGTAGHNNRVLR